MSKKEIGFDGILHRLIKDARKHSMTSFTSPSTVIYDIITALRGPDLDAKGDDWGRLKEYTTARVRSLIVGPNNSPYKAMSDFGALVNVNPLSKEQIKEREEVLSGNKLAHFRSHYHKAVHRLNQLYGYNLLTETGTDNRIKVKTKPKKEV